MDTGALLAAFCCPQHTHPHYMILIVAPNIPPLYHYAQCPVCHHGATDDDSLANPIYTHT